MEKYKNLRLYNLIMGLIHFIQGVIVAVISNDFTLPVDSTFLEVTEQGYTDVMPILEPVRDTLFDIRIGYMVALFLFFSAAAHLILTLPGIYKWYIEKLKKGINYARWYEYAFSASLMIVLISMLTGVYDISALVPLFGVNAAMIFFGLMMELHNQTTKKTDWTSFIYGCIAGIIPWVVIAMNLFGAGEGENKAPTFVYWIFFTIFLFFNSFALNQFLQYKKIGPWKNYVFGERMYILLSLLAKSALAWQIFAGTLRPV